MIVVLVVAVLTAHRVSQLSEPRDQDAAGGRLGMPAGGGAVHGAVLHDQPRYNEDQRRHSRWHCRQIQCVQDLATHYTISLAAVTAATTYRRGGAAGRQQLSKDTKCATLSINQAGTKRTATATRERLLV